jgi:hypothetical protein
MGETTPTGRLKPFALLKQFDDEPIQDPDTDLDEADGWKRQSNTATLRSTRRKAGSAPRDGNEGRTKAAPTSKLIACFEQEVEAATRALNDEIDKLKKDNARLEGENRAHKADIRRLGVYCSRIALFTSVFRRYKLVNVVGWSFRCR